MSSEMKNSEQSKKKRLKWGPALRFPTFRDSGNWDKTELNKLLTIGSGKDYKHLSTGDIPVYGSGGYMLSVNDYLYDGESVCIGRKGTIDNPIFLTGKFWTVDTLFYTHSFIKCVPKFIFYQFQRINWKNYNEAGGIPSLSKTTINKIEILVPSSAEQQKIADFLSSLDNAICLQTQKIDALQQHKKGLIQKLFPAEGETVPELRFGGFKSFPDWNSSTLGELANYTNGKAHENYVTDLGRYVVVNSKFISSEGNVIKRTDNALCISKKNDILMVLSDVPNGKAIAKCYFVDGDNKYTVNQRICKITPKKKVLGDFLFFYLNRNSFLLAFDDGIKQTNLRKEDVLSCPVNYPSLQEQQKIADCLSSLDKLITNETQKLAVLKTHKTGLMQQIFPAMDEVTA